MRLRSWAACGGEVGGLPERGRLVRLVLILEMRAVRDLNRFAQGLGGPGFGPAVSGRAVRALETPCSLFPVPRFLFVRWVIARQDNGRGDRFLDFARSTWQVLFGLFLRHKFAPEEEKDQ